MSISAFSDQLVPLYSSTLATATVTLLVTPPIAKAAVLIPVPVAAALVVVISSSSVQVVPFQLSVLAVSLPCPGEVIPPITKPAA